LLCSLVDRTHNPGEVVQPAGKIRTGIFCWPCQLRLKVFRDASGVDMIDRNPGSRSEWN
jgi:hypothetical protein